MKLLDEEDLPELIRNVTTINPRHRQPDKFVVCSKDGELFLKLFEVSEGTHVVIANYLVREGFQYLGAGLWKREGDLDFSVEFDSSTCLEAFGFDGPQDQAIAREIADDIRETLKALFIKTPFIKRAPR